MLKKNTGRKSWQHMILVFGVTLCVIGAFLMIHGSILGERTVNIALVVSIIGIGIIPHANKGIKR